MAWFTGLFDIFKGGEKALAKDVEKTALKTASSDVIKTSSKITGSAEKAVAGGRSVIKESAADLAKGVGSTAKIGGKVVGVTAIVGGASLATGKIYNYLADEWAMTSAQREQQNQIKLASADNATLAKAQQNNIDYLKQLQAINGSTGSPSLAASGAGGDNSSLFPVTSGSSGTDTSSSSSNIMWYVIGGVALLAAGTYVYSKKTNYARSK